MKKLILLFPIIGLLFLVQVSAQTYTLSEVQSHNTVEDCWMIFENGVYDFSADHLENHELKFMDISDWCGNDMTLDFKSKAGSGEDHKSFVYNDLENYYIGEYSDQTVSTTNDGQTSEPTVDPEEGYEDTETESSYSPQTERKNPYNFWLPAGLAFVSYMLYWGLSKWEVTKKIKIFDKRIFNFTFNTVMVLGLIPSVVFGFIMIAAYSYSSVNDIDFDFLYWHVHLSIAFGVLLVTHFFTRFKLYLVPLKLFGIRL
ncbi:hypothetical protein GF389_05240 [Candidatus Dojkabacteria bacterium]|nr:hypothetical protein [Candidatus Dojkabacteria bacterium]